MCKLLYATYICIILISFFYVIPVLVQEVAPEEDNTTNAGEIKIMNKVCLLKPMEGPCRSHIRMFYFDPGTLSCYRFRWGGCQGNGNRFNSIPECLDFCTQRLLPNQTIRPNYCDLAFDYGFCFGQVKRWYYDRVTKTCKETIYSGCGGNGNNFYVQEHCLRVCQFSRRQRPAWTDHLNQLGS